jgi:hypothetical protein
MVSNQYRYMCTLHNYEIYSINESKYKRAHKNSNALPPFGGEDLSDEQIRKANGLWQ